MEAGEEQSAVQEQQAEVMSFTPLLLPHHPEAPSPVVDSKEVAEVDVKDKAPTLVRAKGDCEGVH